MMTYTVMGVLAAAYKGKRADLAVTLYHAVDNRSGLALCKSVNPGNLVDDGYKTVTCPKCLKALASTTVLWP